ncbi:plectin [Cyclospora cayetanensis]|uniref:Ribosome biogenesis protein NOP53 n=1 Tax=Cyclospora cayetanensis TaxID=88456 RepID=A0A6P6RXT3_9EIME|nr:plectin [Cyclospora cayetanensis]
MRASRKAKWRKTPISAAEKLLDEAPLRERAQELDRNNQLFQIDTQGTEETLHLSQAARRLLQRRQLLVGSDGKSGSSKKVLLDVATQAHKQQLLRVLKGRKQRLEAEAAKRKVPTVSLEALYASDGREGGDDPVSQEQSTLRARAASVKPFGWRRMRCDAACGSGRRGEGLSKAERQREKKRRRCTLETLRSLVPAVVLPEAGISYNPSSETQQKQLIAAAATAVLQQHEGRSLQAVLRSHAQTEVEQLQQQEQLLLSEQDPLKALKRKQPVTAALLQHVSHEALEGLSELDKQRMFMELAVKGRLSAQEEGEATAAAEEGDELSDNDLGKEAASKQSKKKTRTERNRQRRHQQQLRSAAVKQQGKALRKSIDALPQLLQQLQEQSLQQKEARAKRWAGVEAKKAAARKGVVAFKIGRKRFVGGSADAAVPGEVTGSLRTTLVHGAAAAAADRLASFHRRAMLELPAELTAAHATRIKKQVRRVANSRRIVKAKEKGIHAV